MLHPSYLRRIHALRTLPRRCQDFVRREGPSLSGVYIRLGDKVLHRGEGSLYEVGKDLRAGGKGLLVGPQQQGELQKLTEKDQQRRKVFSADPPPLQSYPKAPLTAQKAVRNFGGSCCCAQLRSRGRRVADFCAAKKEAVPLSVRRKILCFTSCASVVIAAASAVSPRRRATARKNAQSPIHCLFCSLHLRQSDWPNRISMRFKLSQLSKSKKKRGTDPT